ncbi:hypothetical protein N7486_008163 [Penicillium sp. IBT 16267x]|nr:hypothetical protein N7486_008163 [Penicillium sp. IBT 16267x]
MLATIGLWFLSAGVLSARTCYNATVEIPVSSRNVIFDCIDTPTTHLDAATRQGGNVTDEAWTENVTISAKYPELSNAMVLTRFSMNALIQLPFLCWCQLSASVPQFRHPSSRTWVTPSSSFFYPPNFDPKILPFCGGDCTATRGTAASIPTITKDVYPSAQVFPAYIQPNTAHGLHLHYNATGGYKHIADYLQRQDLRVN